MKKESLPSINKEQVNEYYDHCNRYALAFAQHIHERDKRSFEQIKNNTIQGFSAKIASVLLKRQDPEEKINFEYQPNIYNNFIDNTDIVSVFLIQDDSDNIKISMNKRKYESILTRMERGSYSKFIEFVSFDRDSDSYIHLGKIESQNLPHELRYNKEGNRVIFEFSGPFEKSNNEILLLV